MKIRDKNFWSKPWICKWNNWKQWSDINRRKLSRKNNQKKSRAHTDWLQMNLRSYLAK